MSTDRFDLSSEVREQLLARGIRTEVVMSQLDKFQNGIPYAALVRPCTLGDGIINLKGGLENLLGIYEDQSRGMKVVKFTPASGAASRMFKSLLSVTREPGGPRIDELRSRASGGDKDAEDLLRFTDETQKFAFSRDLENALEQEGYTLDELKSSGDYKTIVDFTLTPRGLNYANLPKGIIKFHKYGTDSRTAFEEHLVEAASYSQDKATTARVHFTVSPEHLEQIKSYIDTVKAAYESGGLSLEISYSVQKPSTDTIAVDGDNNPFIDKEGKVVLRPGGHGALLENLNDLDCDVAFIKNIDNVVPDRIKGDTVLYKKALGGYLIYIQNRVFEYLRLIHKGSIRTVQIEEMAEFAESKLDIPRPGSLNDTASKDVLTYYGEKLNRPIRVCGVVKNVGDPGGGPFWVREKGGSVSKQIVESSQVDMKSPEQLGVWESSTHFNPVDLVCGLRNYKGEAFDLPRYADPDAGFISIKSKDGRELKALELPGLWNGSMAYWNTVFAEVPLITFNPVKTVFGLLRPEHQPG